MTLMIIVVPLVDDTNSITHDGWTGLLSKPPHHHDRPVQVVVNKVIAFLYTEISDVLNAWCSDYRSRGSQPSLVEAAGVPLLLPHKKLFVGDFFFFLYLLPWSIVKSHECHL